MLCELARKSFLVIYFQEGALHAVLFLDSLSFLDSKIFRFFLFEQTPREHLSDLSTLSNDPLHEPSFGPMCRLQVEGINVFKMNLILNCRLYTFESICTICSAYFSQLKQARLPNRQANCRYALKNMHQLKIFWVLKGVLLEGQTSNLS